MMYHDPKFALDNTAVVLVNVYVSIIGVAFATLWSAHARSTGKYDSRGPSGGSEESGVSGYGETIVIGREVASEKREAYAAFRLPFPPVSPAPAPHAQPPAELT
jgi:hypothetical protein